MNKLLIATKNKGKIKEIKSILSAISSNITTLADIGKSITVAETGKTFRQNAVLKAKTIGQKTNLLTLAEDSGLEVDALNGEPGIKSARYEKGSDLKRLNKVLKKLKGVKKDKRTARFVSVVAIYNPKTKKTSTFKGENRGLITEKPAGINGFGYDPIFFNLKLGKTNAQVSLEEKNRVSHRKKALEKAKRQILKKIK